MPWIITQKQIFQKAFLAKYDFRKRGGMAPIEGPEYIYIYIHTYIYIYIYTYIYIYKFTSGCHSQTTPSSERRQPGPGNVFSKDLNKKFVWKDLHVSLRLRTALGGLLFQQFFYSPYSTIGYSKKKGICLEINFFFRKTLWNFQVCYFTLSNSGKTRLHSWNGLFQEKSKEGGLRKWNFQGYQRNSVWNFQGLTKNEVEFPRVTKKD